MDDKVYQELTRITKSINDGDFFNVPEFLAAVENCKKNNSALHLFGLVVVEREGNIGVDECDALECGDDIVEFPQLSFSP